MSEATGGFERGKEGRVDAQYGRVVDEEQGLELGRYVKEDVDEREAQGAGERSDGEVCYMGLEKLGVGEGGWVGRLEAARPIKPSVRRVDGQT